MHNSSLRQPPPDGVLLYIQEPYLIPRSASWKQSSKPMELDAVPDSIWMDFSDTVEGLCGAMKSEWLMLVPLALLPLGVLLQLQVRATPGIRHSGFVLQVLSVLSMFAIRFWLVSANLKVDKEIQHACACFASRASCLVEYRTEWTGYCKPRGARTLRAIAIGPGAAIGVELSQDTRLLSAN